MRTLFQLIFSLTFIGSVNAQLNPQFNAIPSSFNINSSDPVYAVDIAYDNIDVSKQAFNLFLPDTIGNYPLVIFIHGGGFRAGNKDQIFTDANLQAAAKYYLENDFGFATIGYRLLPPETANYTDSIGVIKCLNDSKRALQFIRYYSDELHIDPAKIGLKGGSAGAGTSLWLATRSDMADVNSNDPILRESTRVCAAHVQGSQSTYDLYKWESVVYNDYDGMGSIYTVDSMVNLLGFDRLADFYGGLDSNYHFLYEPSLIQYREDVDMLYHLSSDDPALYIQSGSSAVHPSDDILHHTLHAAAIYNTAVSAGVSEVIGNINPQGINNSQGESADQFMVRVLNSCSLNLNTNHPTSSSLKLFPNPSHNTIYIEGLEASTLIKIYDGSGILIESTYTSGSISIEPFANGIYFAVIDDVKSPQTIKFIKQ